MYRSGFRHLLLSVGAALAFSAAAHAQGGYGRVVGTVTDPTGAVIPNAMVRLVQHATGAVREVKANSQGYFTVPGLEPSVYDVTITASGFSPVEINGLTVLADQSLTADGHMGLQQANTAVTVESSTVAQVDTTTSTLSQVIEQKRIWTFR